MIFFLAGCNRGQSQAREGEVIFSSNGAQPAAAVTATPAPTPGASPEAAPSAEPSAADPSPTPSEPAETPPPLIASPPPPTDGGNTSLNSHTPQMWSIIPRVGGTPPIGTQNAAYLRPFSAHYRGAETAHIFLTYELTYEAGHTGEVLDTLYERGVSAAFFLTLPYIENNGDLVLRMLAEGHVVGILQVMTAISGDEVSEMVLLTSRHFSENFGRPIDPFLRPVGGAFSEDALRLARHHGFFTVFWSAERHDDFHPGMILSLKGLDAHSAVTVSQIIDDMASAGFTFVSLYQLI